MRALTRMRTLAALCALLLILAGTAMARLPGSPIERPDEGTPGTVEAGEPDTGHNLVADDYWRFLIASQMGNPYLQGLATFLWTHLALRNVSHSARVARR